MLQPITTQRSVTANIEWRGGRNGTDDTDTITLDIARFTSGTHYVLSTDTSQPYSLFKSGVPVGKITASGLYGPFDKAATDGRQVLAGFRGRRDPVRAHRHEGPGRAAVARHRARREGSRRAEPGRRHRHHRPDPVRVRSR